MNGSVGPCLICCRSRKATGCEDEERIGKALRERHSRRHWPKPEQTVVCKDCCIGALDGHHCPWWGFCWKEWIEWPEVV